MVSARRSLFRPRATVAVTLGGAAFVLAYRGPGRALIRGLGGDLLVVIFLVACLASIPWGSATRRVAAIAVFAVVTECSQLLGLVGPESPMVAHLLFGSTFDPYDLAAYAAGLAVAAGLERWWWEVEPPRGEP
jgi:hypothetical protein